MIKFLINNMYIYMYIAITSTLKSEYISMRNIHLVLLYWNTLTLIICSRNSMSCAELFTKIWMNSSTEALWMGGGIPPERVEGSTRGPIVNGSGGEQENCTFIISLVSLLRYSKHWLLNLLIPIDRVETGSSQFLYSEIGHYSIKTLFAPRNPLRCGTLRRCVSKRPCPNRFSAFWIIYTIWMSCFKVTI